MILLPAYFTGYNRRKDRSVSLRFETQELSTTQLGNIDQLVMEEAFGNLLFKENAIQDEDIPTEQAEDEEKTPSQRLRSILFIEWTQKGKQGDFNLYYRTRMHLICEKLKAQLD